MTKSKKTIEEPRDASEVLGEKHFDLTMELIYNTRELMDLREVMQKIESNMTKIHFKLNEIEAELEKAEHLSDGGELN